MKIRLKKLVLNESENKDFEKFVDNSYAEWSNNWNNVNKKIEKNSWSATFEIESDNKIGEFIMDTKGDYLTFLDLEGYLGGEEYQIENGLSLKAASHSSNILVGILFSEAIKHKLIDEDESSYLSMMIFPEWSRGLIPNDVLDEEDVKEFFDKTLEYFTGKDILKVFSIEIEEPLVEADEKEEEFLNFVKRYLLSEIFFYSIKD